MVKYSYAESILKKKKIQTMDDLNANTRKIQGEQLSG